MKFAFHIVSNKPVYIIYVNHQRGISEITVEAEPKGNATQLMPGDIVGHLTGRLKMAWYSDLDHIEKSGPRSLQERLEEAVRKEDFETAAILRDRINGKR